MEPQYPIEPINEAIKRLRALLDNRMKFQRKEFQLFATLVAEKRLWLAHEQDSLARLWDTIRADSALLDFVIDLTRQFFMRTRDLSQAVRDGGYGHENFMDYLADALLESLKQFVGSASMIDVDTLELINEVKLETYRENPWFMVIQLVDMSCYVDMIAPNGLPEPAAAGDAP